MFTPLSCCSAGVLGRLSFRPAQPGPGWGRWSVASSGHRWGNRKCPRHARATPAPQSSRSDRLFEVSFASEEVPGVTGLWRGRSAGMARAWRGPLVFVLAWVAQAWRGHCTGMARAWPVTPEGVPKTGCSFLSQTPENHELGFNKHPVCGGETMCFRCEFGQQ
eukprot:gene11460-biopygen21404